MDTLIIKKYDSFSPKTRYVSTIGEIVVGYKTEKQPRKYLGSILKKNVALGSLEDIQKKLAQNPDIGRLEFVDDGLVYKRKLGALKSDLYNKKEFPVSDKVSITELSLFLKNLNIKHMV